MKYRSTESRLLSEALRRSKKKGPFFDLKLEDIKIPDKCPILGIPLFKGIGACCANSPSLDRKNPLLGYTKDNVWVISHKANSMKRDASPEELFMFGIWVLEKGKL